jgi:hypothetical protein
MLVAAGKFEITGHALWGTAKGTEASIYLVTAYRPDPTRWTTDFLKRVLK